MKHPIFTGWIVNVWRKEDQDQIIIKLQKYFIAILSGIIMILSIGWMGAPSRLTIYIPPDIQNGATLRVGTIPNALIYSFAYELWQEMNYWPSDGEMEYKKNIQSYSYYLTPQFKAELLNDYDALKTTGQLDRIRYLQGFNGGAYESSNIKKINNNTYEIDLPMRLTEYKNNQTVKDVEILYPLKVIRTNVSPKNNPYGLAIAGFIAEPKRVTTYI